MTLGDDLLQVLQKLLLAQQHQTAMLEKFIDKQGEAQTAQTTSLNQWKAAHPEIAKQCSAAFQSLDQMQTDLIVQLTEAVETMSDGFESSDFMLMELIDKFGPRLTHLNNLRVMMSQLSSTS